MAPKFSDKVFEAAYLIGRERTRQQTQEGYTPAHDDEHTDGQLALLAAAYALSGSGDLSNAYLVAHQIRDDFLFKPKDPIRDLTRAGALILAELERRLRAISKEEDTRLVTVCSACLRATCWQGEFYCEKYKEAGTKELPIAKLRKLNLENPSWWIPREPV